MNCPIYKSENEAQNKFCIVCGIKISNVDFINNLDFINQNVEISQNSSSSIQIKNSTVHGGISLNGTANGKDESINIRSKRSPKGYTQNLKSIHIGDKIGNQVTDSIIQQSNINTRPKCPNCGSEVKSNEKFCLECGAKLGGNS